MAAETLQHCPLVNTVTLLVVFEVKDRQVAGLWIGYARESQQHHGARLDRANDLLYLTRGQLRGKVVKLPLKVLVSNQHLHLVVVVEHKDTQNLEAANFLSQFEHPDTLLAYLEWVLHIINRLVLVK